MGPVTTSGLVRGRHREDEITKQEKAANNESFGNRATAQDIQVATMRWKTRKKILSSEPTERAGLADRLQTLTQSQYNWIQTLAPRTVRA